MTGHLNPDNHVDGGLRSVSTQQEGAVHQPRSPRTSNKQNPGPRGNRVGGSSLGLLGLAMARARGPLAEWRAIAYPVCQANRNKPRGTSGSLGEGLGSRSAAEGAA